MRTIEIPELALVALIGASGSGKSTFGRRHFLPTEVLSSDFFRGLVSDDENDQAATGDAFNALYYMLAKRLARGRLTVVDATNVRPEDRKRLVEHARQYHCFAIAIVLNASEKTCLERNRNRPERSFGPHVVRRQLGDLKRGMRGLEREGFRYVHLLNEEDIASDQVEIRRIPLWNNKKDQAGPFDIFGDLHGCADELEGLLTQLGWERSVMEEPDAFWGGESWRHPEGRRAIFLGDLVDRGDRVLDTVRIARNMVKSGAAFCIAGNHDISSSGGCAASKCRLSTAWSNPSPRSRRLDRMTVASWRRSSTDWSATTFSTTAGWWSRMRDCGRRCTGAAPARCVSSPLRRDYRRDRRVRAAGTLQLGRRVSRQGGGRVRPHAGAGTGVVEQHG